jgi:TRAP transporter 4TM/12TM fusion protein
MCIRDRVTGSSMANVAGVGSFTIPLMKSIGYRKEFAAGVEACSGMGAQIMPPVMGGSVFIMMEILGISYWSICVAAFPIAILYYIGLFFAVDYEAVRLDLKGLERKTLPSFWKTLIGGWYLVAPIAVLIYLLIAGVTPQRAAFYAIVTTIVIGVIPKDMRLNFKKILEVLEMGAKDALVVIGLVSAASLIQGITTVTGLGLQLSTILIDLAQGNLFWLLVLTAFTSILLGLGLPIMVCYTLLAVLVAPALITMGVLPIAAHLFIFYYGVLATISPPVAPDCFVAAGIAGADANKSMWESCRIAVPIFLIPFLFVYSPVFILQAKASIWTYLWVFGTGILGIYAITSGLQGVVLYASRLNYVERVVLFIAGCVLIAPLYLETLIGLIVLIIVQGWHLMKAKKVKVEV